MEPLAMISSVVLAVGFSSQGFPDGLLFITMAKQRIINTKFWSDPYIQALKTDEKLLYLYLLTNEQTSICGIYEITESTMSFDTGLSVPRLRQIVDSLVHAHKLRKIGDWVYLTNFNKHQKNNPSVKLGIERAIKELPEGLFDRLGTDWVQPGLLKPEPELKLKPELKRPNKFSDECDEVKYSKLLYELITKNNPKHLPPDFQKWAEVIDFMIRIDKRTPQEIEAVIFWCQQDVFWRKNILSTNKLREKFDQLWAAASSQQQSKRKNVGAVDIT